MAASCEPAPSAAAATEVLPRPRARLPLSGRLATVVLALVVFVAVLVPLAPLPSPRTVDTARSLAPPLSGRVLEETAELQPREGEPADAWIDRGFGELGWVSRLMVRARVAVFGRWSLSGVLGRDELGRDLLARICWGARVSLAVAVVAAVVTLFVGVPWGAVAGWAGGRVDDAMMRAVDVLNSIPLVFLVVFLVTVLGEDSIRLALDALGIGRLAIFFLVVAAVSWLSMARIVRGRLLELRDATYVEAARASGASPMRILLRHVVPNLAGTVVVTLSLTVPRVMLFESFLSFLGLGVQPPDVSWGLLANAGLKALIPIDPAWWLFVFPSAALAVTLLALGFLGDALEAVLDPRRHR
jgi:oligopeptide transport system permease protein